MEKLTVIAAVLPVGKFFDQVYHEVLEPWSHQLGAALHRVEVRDTGLGAICAAIEGANLLVADLSGRDARAIYLAGYAHGTGKRVLFITQLEQDFPFPVGNQHLVVYSGNLELLRKELERFSSSEPSEGNAADPRARFIIAFGEILRAHSHEHKGRVEMENAQTFVLWEQDMDLPLVQALSRRARELGVRLKLM